MGEARPVETRHGIAERLLFHADGTFALQRTCDVTAAIEANKELRKSGDGYSPSRDLRRVASIPVAVQFEWLRRYGADPLAKGNEALLRRLLNDPEWAHLRTAPGRV
jgi:hypothetical protein